MIRREQIEELLSLPVDERRRLLQLLQESLPGDGERQSQPKNEDQPSPAAKWLLSISGRYSGGPGDNRQAPMESLAQSSIIKSGFTLKPK